MRPVPSVGTSIPMRRVTMLIAFLACCTALAYDYTTSFEAVEGYTNGPIHGQCGWTLTNAPSPYIFASVVSGPAHGGSQYVLFENHYLATTIRFVIRRSIPSFVMDSNTVSAIQHWTPVSGSLASESGWSVRGGSSYYTGYASVLSGGSPTVGIRFNLGSQSSGAYPFVPQDFSRWNCLSSQVSAAHVLATGEVVTWYSNTLSNVAGRHDQVLDNWLKTFPETRNVLEFYVDVEPQSSIALDSLEFHVMPFAEASSFVLELSILPPARLGWPTRAGHEYQLQWVSCLATGRWNDTGPRIPGNGNVTNAVGLEEGVPLKYYRVAEY